MVSVMEVLFWKEAPTFLNNYEFYIIMIGHFYNVIFINFYEMKGQKMLDSNLFYLKTQNQLRMQQSVRLLQYINMYNLKKDEIIYQCPLLSEPNHDDFDLEVECLEQMADIQIIYNKQRKQQLKRVKIQQEKLMEKKMKQQEQQRKKRGFLKNLFSSSSKDKQSKSLIKKQQKPTINQSLMKSSIYMPKKEPIEPNPKIQIKPSTQPPAPAQNLIKKPSSQLANAKKSQPKPNIKIENKIQSEAQNAKQMEQQKKISSSSHFNQEQLVDFDEDLLDNLNESMQKNKKQMSHIVEQNQQDAESICKRFSNQKDLRDSRVSRVYAEDVENKQRSKKNTTRMSKRSKKLLESDQDQIVQKQQKQKSKQKPQQIKMMKKKSNVHKNQKSSQKQPKSKLKKAQLQQSLKKQDYVNDSTKLTNKKSSQQNQSPQKLKKYLPNFKQPKQNPKKSHISNKQKDSQNVLSSHIQKQISRLSYISHDDDLMSQLSQFNSKKQIQKSQQKISMKNSINVDEKQDSFSDVKIDWLVKIEACQLQQKLLMNRLIRRWNQPFKIMNQIKNMKFQDFSKEVNNDPRYKWTRPNLNFGKIIQ